MPSTIGAPRRRVEDGLLVTGRGGYLADQRLPGEVVLVLVRSPHAHARIDAVDLAAARALPGVVGVYSAAELGPTSDLPVYPAIPGPLSVPPPPLARGEVRYVGEPVVAVVAERASLAEDAAGLVEVSYTPLAAVTTLEAALAEDAPTVHAAAPGNVVVSRRWGGGDVDAAFAAADHVVELVLRNGRVAPVPLEPRGGIGQYHPASGDYTLVASTQVPHRLRSELATALGIAESQLRIIAPDVGGGFGGKACAYPEDLLLLLLARLVGRPVKWVASRIEDLATTMHSRESRVEAAAAFARDGTLLGLRVHQAFNQGAYLPPLALIPASRAAVLVPGAYRVANVDSQVQAIYTHTAPSGPYRGAGRPEASFLVERLMDLAARDLAIDPAELRRRNLLTPDAFPYTTPTGLRYDSGDYLAALDLLLERADYARLRERQAQARARGEFLGIGLATFVEPTGGAVWEGAQVRVERSGEVVVLTGAGTHGQGHDTTLAQVAAERLHVPFEAVRVRHGDTAVVPPGVGSFGSRTAAMAGAAVAQAAERVADKARRIAAHLLEVAAADIELADGGFAVAGAAARSVSLRQVAAAAYAGLSLPAGEEPGLEAQVLYRQVDEMYAFGAYLAVARVDRETGQPQIEQIVGVDDSGVLINPLLAEGQIQGGIAQGLGQALLEQVAYGPDGQLLTTSLLDYALPRAASMPPLALGYLETPSPLNPLGAKGVGEAGTVGAPTAIVGAILDALSGLGVRQVDMPLSGQTLWHLLARAPG